MAVSLPYKSERSARRPKASRDFDNGKIPAEHLFDCGIRNFVMVQPAARAMKAMVAAARNDGVTVSATGTWRGYDRQVALFLERYSTTPVAGRKPKHWKGQNYWLKPGNAGAATPGTSNHGRGVAADLSEGPSTSLTTKTLKWLAANGPKYGYYNTVKSEPWHWCFCNGDDVPSAVLSAEKKFGIDSGAPIDWDALDKADKDLASVEYPGLLKRGSRGTAVMAAQWKLAGAGHECATDGAFGPQTERAVRAFQLTNGLEVDGIIGPHTWGKLGLPGGAGGPVPIDTPIEIPEAVDGTTTYVVQPGDAFLLISKRTLWSGGLKAGEAIAEANGLALDSPIHPGQELTIPDCRATVVGAGDDWDAIAKRLGRTAAKVRSANEWQGGLRPGMTIYGGAAAT